jgi:hypothetical protein
MPSKLYFRVEARVLNIFCPILHLLSNLQWCFITLGASGPGGPEFAEFKKETLEKHTVGFHTSLDALPPVEDGVKRLALISGRTGDNPRLLGEAIKVCLLIQISIFI